MKTIFVIMRWYDLDGNHPFAECQYAVTTRSQAIAEIKDRPDFDFVAVKVIGI